MDVGPGRLVMVEAVARVGRAAGRPVDALHSETGSSARVFHVRRWIESVEDIRRIFDPVNATRQQALNEAGTAMSSRTHALDLRGEPETADCLSQAFRWRRKYTASSAQRIPGVDTSARHKKST